MEINKSCSQRDNPWSNLSTITTFDRGDNAHTTVRLENRTATQSNRQLIRCVTPSASLLIESLIQQLCTVFEGDAVRRNKLYYAICNKLYELGLIDSSYNMMEYEGIRGQYQHALYRLVTIARAATGSETPLQVPNSFITEWSRYRREFHEISFIARGGFGSVYKALHRLDGINYAIKKIIVRSGQVKTITQHLEEVKSLAKLNHTNIVAYKTAWIEPTVLTASVPSLPSVEQSKSRVHTLNTMNKRKANRSKSHINKDSEENIHLRSESTQNDHSLSNDCREEASVMSSQKIIHRTEQRIIEESTSDNEEETSDIVSFRNDSNDSTNNNERLINDADSMEASDSCEESDSNQQICEYTSQMDNRYATLYIQMALCEKTLQQWLSERDNPTSHTVITTILTQIVCGLDYIHSRDIVHHDIKPSNIFITTSGRLQVQLGDFGLACPLRRENHDSIVGTQVYAAPEQLEGKCDPKSDIYSVGIVLLELLIHTKTHMERNKIISALKRGQIPMLLTIDYPKWAHILSQLVQKDPAKRPSTQEFLQNLNEDKDLTIAQLKDIIDEKNDTIHQLEEKISVLEAHISKFKIPLENR